MAHILVVDDEEAFTSGIAEYLRLQDHSVVSTNSVASARKALAERRPSVVLLDLMLPDGSGLDLFTDFEKAKPDKIIIITGHSGIKSLIGDVAGDGVAYMQKPIEPRELLGLINAAASADDDEAATGGGAHFDLLIGESDVMHAVYKQIEQVAGTDSTVFVQGESGTGKELVADAIHRLSKRKGSFVPVNCGGLTKDLVSSQLFGHEKGSFTGATSRHVGLFERADAGTLFLDEITEMPADMQTQLLRVLETGKVMRVGGTEEIAVDARLVAATNREPGQAVRDGVLREDLYFRLRVFPITLPPLRERGEDIALLADHFLRELNEKNDSSKAFADDGIERLRRHGWPGNVRELKHTIHRAYIMADSDVVTIPAQFDDDLPADVEGLSVGRSIADVERDLILKTLEHYDGDKKAAAASLGISLKTLYNRLKEYDQDD